MCYSPRYNDQQPAHCRLHRPVHARHSGPPRPARAGPKLAQAEVVLYSIRKSAAVLEVHPETVRT